MIKYIYFLYLNKYNLNWNYLTTCQAKLQHRERENKLIIWALFDDAESSYKNAISKYFDKLNIEVHSVGINDIKFPKSKKYFYHKIDLSITNFNLLKQLSNLPKPDIILASPPCESWSGADCSGKMTVKIGSNWNWTIKNKSFYDEHNKICNPVKRRYFDKKERTRICGEATIGGTILIIQHFKPKVWIIENPKTSKTWDFQKNHWNFLGIMNDTYYSAYNLNFSLKPTIFKSNIKLSLLKKRPKKSNNDHMALGSYSKRSSIPGKLIKNIIEQCINYIKDGVKC